MKTCVIFYWIKLNIWVGGSVTFLFLSIFAVEWCCDVLKHMTEC